jgi:hypothetical protein
MIKQTEIKIGNWYSATMVFKNGTIKLNIWLKYWGGLSVKETKNIEWSEYYVSAKNEEGKQVLDKLLKGYKLKDETKWYLETYCKPSSVKEWGTQRMGVLD